MEGTVLKKIAIVLGIVVVLVLILASMQPNTFRVERSATVKAKPATVFAQVNDFHKWSAWSPWEKMDPGMKRTFEGKAKGKGAAYAWEGNGKVGAGRMEIAESTPSSKI